MDGNVPVVTTGDTNSGISKMDVKNIIKKLRKRYGCMLENLAKQLPKREFAFCESVHATSTSPWHIRKLPDQGLKTGGGADTKALCGREVCWDLEVEVTSFQPEVEFGCCVKCVTEYGETQNG